MRRGVLIAATVLLGACATKGMVRKQTTRIESKMQQFEKNTIATDGKIAGYVNSLQAALMKRLENLEAVVFPAPAATKDRLEKLEAAVFAATGAKKDDGEPIEAVRPTPGPETKEADHGTDAP